MRGSVYTYVNYAKRPAPAWIRATAERRWGVQTLYTRFTTTTAIAAVEGLTGLSRDYTVLDAAAKLVLDTARDVGWSFAIYVQDRSGNRLVIAFSAGEGTYVTGYGLSVEPAPQTTVPLNLVDWVRAVAKARNWTPSNLP
jgi:hypothetical protein